MEGEERPKRVIQEHRLGSCAVTRGLTPAHAPPAVRIRHRAPSRAVTYSTFPDQSFPPERGCGRTVGLSCTPVGVSGLRGTPGCADCSGRSTASPAPGDAALMLRVKGWLQAPAGLGAAREDSAQPPRFRSCHQLPAPSDHKEGWSLVVVRHLPAQAAASPIPSYVNHYLQPDPISLAINPSRLGIAPLA